jgi:hypothetical protein
MMAADPSRKSDDMICSLCRYPGSDLRLVGCGCCVHAVSPFSLDQNPENFLVELRVRFGHLITSQLRQ